MGIPSFSLVRMVDDGCFKVCGIPLKRVTLVRLIRLAQRNGNLFGCLKLTEYMFLRLVVKVTEKVRSPILARALSPIIKKLLEAVKGFHSWMMKVLGKVDYWMMVKGWDEARQISLIAEGWGNKMAREWAEDAGFAKYLTIIYMPFWEKSNDCKSSKP